MGKVWQYVGEIVIAYYVVIAGLKRDSYGIFGALGSQLDVRSELRREKIIKSRRIR